MHSSEEFWFDHEKLEVYREAIAFVVWLSTLLEATGRIGEVKDQLDRESTSIALNISISPRATASTLPRIAAGSLTSPMALRSNVPPVWTFSWPKRS